MGMGMGIGTRTSIASAFAIAIAGAACVDPRTDYDDFVNRTNGVRGVSTAAPSDAAVQEAAAIDGGFTAAPFFVACLPHLVGGNLTKALRFVGTLSYTPTSMTGTKAGKLDIAITPLTVHSTDLSAIVGDPITASTVAVGDDGSFLADFGAPIVKGAANPISTNDIVFSSISITGKLLRDDYACGNLNGVITSPQMIVLDEPDNYCIFERLPALTGTTPTITADQFQGCP
jgi:hypothetical protein